MFNKILLVPIFFIVFVVIDASAQTETHHLTVKANPNIIFIDGSGDYRVGTTVTLDGAPESWRDYTFVGWQIDGRWSVDNPLVVTMDRSHTAEAIYERTGVIGGVVIDTIPRVAEITVDGTIYLPNELPLTFNWATNSQHVIGLSAAVNDGFDTRYVFDKWKDQNQILLRTVLVEEGDEFIALYKTQHKLKAITEHGTVIGSGWHDAGKTVHFEIDSKIIESDNDDSIRYVFGGWDKGDYQRSTQNSIDFVNPVTVRADWKTQYNLNLQTNVPDYNIAGGGWNPVGKSITLIAETEFDSPDADVKYVFEKWVSKGANPVVIPNAQSPITTITVDNPYTIEAKYKESYRVNVWTSFGAASGDGFYTKGTVAEIQISKPAIVVDENKIRKVFTGWDYGNARTMGLQEAPELDPEGKPIGGQNLLVFVDKPLTITAGWKTQYNLDVDSDEGRARGSGWYDVGKVARFSVKDTTTTPGFWTAYTFVKWTGDHEGTDKSGIIIMSTPKTIIAEWKEDNTPGILNSFILAGVGAAGIFIYSKTHKSIKISRNQVKDLIDEAKPFEKFFSLRKRKSDSDQHPSFYVKRKKKKAFLNWMMGKD